MLAADDKVWDQNAFNDLFRRGLNFAAPRSQDRTFMCVRIQGSRACDPHLFICAHLGVSVRVPRAWREHVLSSGMTCPVVGGPVQRTQEV